MSALEAIDPFPNDPPPRALGGIAMLAAAPDDAFIDGKKGGFQVKSAAQALVHALPGVGWNALEGKYFAYDNGVWVDGEEVVHASAVAMLGDRYRGSHLQNLRDVLRHQDGVRRIDVGSPSAGRFINTLDGLVDWRERRLYAHTLDDAGTIQYPVHWTPAARCHAFLEFLAEVLPADCILPTEESPHGFIWEVIGYALYVGNPLQLAILLHGGGGNGKGRFLHVLDRLAGDVNTAHVNLVELENNRFRAAELYGKSLNIAGDLDPKWLTTTGTFKSVTGGDRIQVERKYGQPFDFTPFATPFYSTNKPFGAVDNTEGFWRRFCIIPFPNSLRSSGRSADDIDAANEAELDAIAYKAICALSDLMRRGRFIEPPSVARAKEEFRQAADPIRAWIADCCILDAGSSCGRTEAWESFKRWHDEQEAGGRTPGRNTFYERLRSVDGITEHRTSTWKGFTGFSVAGPQLGL